jgi:MoaA/NifB/PqqE/SkfB family radical SAM enzyme
VKYKNIFLNEIEILQNKVVLKSKPRELDITITTRCNLRCIMCDIHELSDYIIDDKMYIYIKNTLPYLENIIWKGGEVFLYNKFYEFINLASQYNVRQTIITNGLLLTDDYVKLIAQYQIELVISIDATDKKTYEKIREGANFNVLINNLKILEKYYGQNNLFKYKMAVVVMSINYNQIEQLINFAILHKFESIHFQACTNCKNKYLLLQDLKKKEVIEQIEKYKNKYKNSIAILTDDTLNMKRFTELRNADLLSVSQTAESKPVLDEKNNYANENLSIKKFCYRPFLKIALNPERNNINFGCGCTDIDVSKYQYDEIWNCSELVQYRKSIVSNDLSICKL